MLRHFYYKSTTELEIKYFRTRSTQKIIPTKQIFWKIKNFESFENYEKNFEHGYDISGFDIYFSSTIKIAGMMILGYFRLKNELISEKNGFKPILT